MSITNGNESLCIFSAFSFNVLSRRTSDMSLDRLDISIPKSKTVRAAPRTDSVARKNKVTAGQGSPARATTVEDLQPVVPETTELPPEPELGNFTLFIILKSECHSFLACYIYKY
jgi:hypothetical protein